MVPKRHPTKLQAGFSANQDFLGFWIVDICREGHSQRSAPQKRHMTHPCVWEGAPVLNPENWAAGMGEVITRSLQLGATPCAKHLVTWAAQTWEGHKTRQAQPSLHLCRVPENLNLSGLGLGSAFNPGPASDSSWQSNLEPEQCSLGKHTRCERGGKPSVAETLRAPPTHASDICSQCSSLPTHHWISEPKKVTTTAPLCQGRN